MRDKTQAIQYFRCSLLLFNEERKEKNWPKIRHNQQPVDSLLYIERQRENRRMYAKKVSAKKPIHTRANQRHNDEV